MIQAKRKNKSQCRQKNEIAYDILLRRTFYSTAIKNEQAKRKVLDSTQYTHVRQMTQEKNKETMSKKQEIRSM